MKTVEYKENNMKQDNNQWGDILYVLTSKNRMCGMTFSFLVLSLSVH